MQGSTAPLRLLVVASPGTEGTVADVFRRLHDAGIELVFAEGRRGHGISAALLDLSRVSVAPVPLEREGKDAKTVRTFRHTANVVRFLDPTMEGGSWTRNALMKTVLEKFKHPDAEAPIKPDLPEPVWQSSPPSRGTSSACCRRTPSWSRRSGIFFLMQSCCSAGSARTRSNSTFSRSRSAPDSEHPARLELGQPDEQGGAQRAPGSSTRLER